MLDKYSNFEKSVRGKRKDKFKDRVKQIAKDKLKRERKVKWHQIQIKKLTRKVEYGFVRQINKLKRKTKVSKRVNFREISKTKK